eukprot:m.158359 g.158359  ORF g.158359 m.158359 type:complete len:59 (+) comp38734_c1_seq21:1405-1581(+)
MSSFVILGWLVSVETGHACNDYPYSWSVPSWHPPTEKYKKAKANGSMYCAVFVLGRQQ